MNKLLFTTLLGLLLVNTGFAQNFDASTLNSLKQQANTNVSVPVPTPVPQVDRKLDLSNLFHKKADWTIMVFINGKNNLSDYVKEDLNEMEVIGSSKKIHVVAELGQESTSAEDGYYNVNRYYVTRDTDTNKIGSKLIANLKDADMGDYKHLIEFGKWAKKKYPAKNYMLIIENHGSGWSKGKGSVVTRGISYDDQTGNHINTPNLGVALQQIGDISVLGMDACLMQMTEVAYEIKDHVAYVVGSEETEPGAGNDYTGFLRKLSNQKKILPLTVAKAYADAYGDQYDADKTGYTQSVVATSALKQQFVTLVNNFVDAATASNEKTILLNAVNGTLFFDEKANKDMGDFLSIVIQNTQDQKIKTAASALLNYVANAAVVHNRSLDSAASYWSDAVAYSKAKGLAVYIPSRGIEDGYSDLAWSKATKWMNFIEWLYQK